MSNFVEFLDIYRINETSIVIDLNPAKFIEMTNSEICQYIGHNMEIHRTTDYNVAIYGEISLQSDEKTILINNTSYKIREILPLHKVTAQLCIVLKDEWHLVLKYIEYYKCVHGIERFILYDNQSTKRDGYDNIVSRDDVIITVWDIPYKYKLIDKSKLESTYDGPEEIIIAQNSAYSHCLKFYRQATWTVLLDLDEFIVRRQSKPSLNSILNNIEPMCNSIYVKGYWAGCNKFQRNEISRNLDKISHRSPEFCKNKIILRTSEHRFTKGIHDFYDTDGSKKKLSVIDGQYFFHMYTLSPKKRRCFCNKFCSVNDKSFLESWKYHFKNTL